MDDPNIYAYVGGNPIGYVDPLGLSGAAVGALPWYTELPGIGGLLRIAANGPGGIIVGALWPTEMGYSACENMGPGACARMYNESSEVDSCPADKGKGQRGLPTKGEPGT